MDVNASDTRNKADKSAKAGMGGKLSNAIKELANNTALGVAQDGRRKRVCTDKFHAPIYLARLCMRFLKDLGEAHSTRHTHTISEVCPGAVGMMHLSAAVVCLPSAVMQMCLIMDEVDGMSAGDRGGVADLIQTLKGAKLPIICICNDKYNQKLKSLRNHCLELDFRCDPCSSSLQCCASMQTILPCVSGSAHAIHC